MIKAPVVARTQFMSKPEPTETKKIAKPAAARASSGEATLPPNFPTVADLQGLGPDEKLALADEAEAFAERLVRKAEAAEKFATGPIVGLLFFLKSGAEKQAVRARETADLAEAEASRVRSAATSGGNGALIGGIAALVVVGGAAAVVLGNGVSLPSFEGGASTSSSTVKITKANPRAKATSPMFQGSSQKAPALRDVEAMQAMEKVANGEMDASSLYDAMRR
mmetsp:Transcript_6729/g.22068  ORF Transcript_6729/g.22068 Transcript_6729/m.22068 type:complete len:223 (+) Transcript_6729:406-1074(+)